MENGNWFQRERCAGVIGDESRSAADRDIARAALARLYSYAQTVEP